MLTEEQKERKRQWQRDYRERKKEETSLNTYEQLSDEQREKIKQYQKDYRAKKKEEGIKPKKYKLTDEQREKRKIYYKERRAKKRAEKIMGTPKTEEQREKRKLYLKEWKAKRRLEGISRSKDELTISDEEKAKRKEDRRLYQINYREVNKPVVAPKQKNYLNNIDLFKEIVYCKEAGKLSPRLSDMFYVLVKNVVLKKRHKDNDDRLDMIQHCMLRLLTNWHNFDENRYDNPFTYLTEIVKRAMAELWNKLYRFKGDKFNKVGIVRIDMMQKVWI